MLIQWIGVALILTCKGLLVGNRGQLSSPRSVAGIAAGIVGSALFLGELFYGGPRLLSWAGVIVWGAACVYVVIAMRSDRRRADQATMQEDQL